MYYRQLGELTLTVSRAKKIADEDWAQYLEGSLAITKKFRVAANVSLLCCVNAYPNARQRQVASDFMERNYLREMDRIAVITESTVIRGAMLAFSWIMPQVRVSAFGSTDAEGAFRWLREVGTFNEAQALGAWIEAQGKLGISPNSLRPPKLG